MCRSLERNRQLSLAISQALASLEPAVCRSCNWLHFGMTKRDIADLFDLTGRVAIITGGTRGIGRALAEGFAACGAKVVVASRKAAACAETEDALVAQGAEALGVATHMGDLAAIEHLVEATVDRFGALDIVVNNAATALTMPIAQITPEAWEKSYSVNLLGPVFLARTAFPHLTRSEHAAILNVISVGALTWSPTTAMYSGAKAALLSFTRNMAAEWAPQRIRVNALAPGTVDTDMVRNTGPEAIERMAQISWQKRIAAPDEMIGPALFLVSDAASYVTGQLLVADGGYAVAR
jgi:NAD(P)-dependent dehydrogenase (short-subunit alcohol dehydrogenase family)